MKTIVENPLHNYFVSNYYIRILNICMGSVNEDNLRENMKTVFGGDDTAFCTYFEYGFGGHHMWVNERNCKERLIIVEF